MSKTHLTAALIAAITLAAQSASAETSESTTIATEAAPIPPAEATTTATETPIVASTVAPPPAEQPAPLHESRARFSGKRLLVEGLVGGLVGSLAAYGAYSAAGGDSVGAAFLGLGANIAVTPLVVYGTGRMMGGEGSVKASYYGALFGLTAPGTAAAASDAYTVTLAIGVVLMPFTSALFYEASSNMRSTELQAVARGLSISPTAGGMRANLSLQF